MLKAETGKSDTLGTRIADLKARMLEAQITKGEMQTFQKVAAIMDYGQGRIDGDDLIAASFLAGTS
ncbi:hypothetical protein ACWGTO_00260 [Mesorhizobium sp. PL10]